MFNNRKNDPIVDSVKAVMEQSEMFRQIEQDLLEQYGVVSRKALPHEIQPEFDAVLAEAKKCAMEAKKLDPVGHEDVDIDNDGDSDKTDKYLHNRRKAIGSAIAAKKDEKKDLEEAKMTRSQKQAAIRKYFAHDPKTGEDIIAFGKKKRAEEKGFKSGAAEIKRLEKKGLEEGSAQDYGIAIRKRTMKDPKASAEAKAEAKAYLDKIADKNKDENLPPRAKKYLGLKEDSDHLDEKLTKSMSAGDVISDFVHSKDPKFKGKSKKERTKMALGAYYGMNPEKSNVNESSIENIRKQYEKNEDSNRHTENAILLAKHFGTDEELAAAKAAKKARDKEGGYSGDSSHIKATQEIHKKYYGKLQSKMDEDIDSITEEIRNNLEYQLIAVYESGDEAAFTDFVDSLTEEQAEILGLNESGPRVTGASGTPLSPVKGSSDVLKAADRGPRPPSTSHLGADASVRNAPGTSGSGMPGTGFTRNVSGPKVNVTPGGTVAGTTPPATKPKTTPAAPTPTKVMPKAKPMAPARPAPGARPPSVQRPRPAGGAAVAQKRIGYSTTRSGASAGETTMANLMREASYEKDLADDEPRIVSGVKGMKSTPFKKKFKSQEHQDKWADSEDAGDYTVHRVEKEKPQIKESFEQFIRTKFLKD